MKKFLIISTMLNIVLLSACTVDAVNANTASNKNYSEWNTNHFDKAIIDIHSEIIEVSVKSWKDYENSDAIIIETTDGKLYYTNLRDCTLINTEQY